MKTALLTVARWPASLTAGMFYGLAALFMFECLDESKGFPAITAMLANYLTASSIGLWVLRDARQRGRRLPYDFGTFVFFGWMLVVPIYLFSTRGWGGLKIIGAFILICIAAGVVGTLPMWLR